MTLADANEDSETHVGFLLLSANRKTIPSSLLTVCTPLMAEARGLPIILCLFYPAAFSLEALPSGSTNPPIAKEKKKERKKVSFIPKITSTCTTTPSVFLSLAIFSFTVSERANLRD